jgi:hypothetical protein
MPEFYKRVHATQFKPSDEDKARVLKGDRVEFDGNVIKHNGGGRFHVLIPVGELLTPLQETQWLVRNPSVEVYGDTEFKSKFIQPGAVHTEPTQKKAEVAPPPTAAAPVAAPSTVAAK